MVAIYYRQADKIIRETDLRALPQVDPLNVVWIDLNRLDDLEKRYISNKFGINLYEKQQQALIFLLMNGKYFLFTWMVKTLAIELTRIT